MSTWATNVQGSVNLLEALRPLPHRCSVVMVTTDKVYENQEWDYGYRESDRLGGRALTAQVKLLQSWQLPVGEIASAVIQSTRQAN